MLKKLLISLLLLCFLSACTNPALSEDAEAARANLVLANAYLEQGHYAEAKSTLLVATHQAPHEAFVWNSWAYYADLTGESEAADLYYRKAIHLEPRLGVFHNNYGVFLCRQGHYALAIQQFLLAARDPGYLYPGRAYHNASLCAAQQGNHQKEVDFFEQKAKRLE